MISAKFSGSSCVLRLMFSAGIPADMARLTSNPDDASMWMPLEEKNLRIAELGQAFIAYRTVNPYALGKAKHASAASWSFSKEYA